MRGILRATAYFPLGTMDGRRAAGPDEDGFTLGAAALERLSDAIGGTLPAGRLLVAGDVPATEEADLVRFIGSPGPCERVGGDERELRAALTAAMDPAQGSDAVTVVAVDLRSRDSSRGDAGPPLFPDVAVALLVGDGASFDPRPLWETRAPGSVPVAAALIRTAQAAVPSGSNVWVGDWDASPATSNPVARPRTPSRVPPEDGPVSQGAYVPRARYLENLGSRWWFAGEKCSACGTVTFPVRARCHQCGVREGLGTVRLPRNGGMVVASTVIRPGGQPTEFDDQVESNGPYGVVLVELIPGVRVTLQATDSRPGELTIGSRVGTRLRRLYRMEGEWRYGRKAVPMP